MTLLEAAGLSARTGDTVLVVGNECELIRECYESFDFVSHRCVPFGFDVSGVYAGEFFRIVLTQYADAWD